MFFISGAPEVSSVPARGRLPWKVGWMERSYAFILTTYNALLIVCGKNVYISFHLGLLWTQGNFSVHTLGTLNFSPVVFDAYVPCLLPHICVSKTTHRKAVNAAPGCQAAVELPSTEGAGGDHKCAFLCSCLRGWMTSGGDVSASNDVGPWSARSQTGHCCPAESNLRHFS